MRMGDPSAVRDIEVVSTGSLGLDLALGVGGLPRGRVVEVYGPEASGKTTLTLEVVARMQRNGGTAAFIDAEHALDPQYAEKIGVDVDELLVSQPDTGEQALEIADMIVRSGAVDVVIIDSVAALTPKAEIEGEMGDSHVGLQARLMSQALRKLTANIKRSNTLVIFINQIRMKIGVMFGSPETTTGGNALKFYASVRLDIRRIGAIKKRDEVIGNETRVKVVKNKVAPPFKQVQFDILYGEGISREGELIDLGVKHGIIDKSGAWYSYNGDRIGQGRDNVRDFLKQNEEVAHAIDVALRDRLLSGRRRLGREGRGRGGGREPEQRVRVGAPGSGRSSCSPAASMHAASSRSSLIASGGDAGVRSSRCSRRSKRRGSSARNGSPSTTPIPGSAAAAARCASAKSFGSAASTVATAQKALDRAPGFWSERASRRAHQALRRSDACRIPGMGPSGPLPRAARIYAGTGTIGARAASLTVAAEPQSLREGGRNAGGRMRRRTVHMT